MAGEIPIITRNRGSGGGRGSEILAVLIVIGILIFLAIRAYSDR